MKNHDKVDIIMALIWLTGILLFSAMVLGTALYSKKLSKEQPKYFINIEGQQYELIEVKE